MKGLIKFVLLFVILASFGLGATNPAWGSVLDLPDSADPDQSRSGMPGWPLPDKPIPHHDPGHLSRASSYTTQVLHEDEVGVQEVVQISGLDAMIADGFDPLAGSYRLVSKEDIALGVYDITNYSIALQTFQDSTIDLVPGSEVELAPTGGNGHQSLDLAAGDLNGDGVDEQIAAWADVDTHHIMLAIGEMPGTNGVPSSGPAATASGDQIDLLVRGYDQALWKIHYDGENWGEWDNDGGGVMFSGPAVVSLGNGVFEVFVVGADDNQLYQRGWDGSAWGPWSGLPKDDIFSPVPASNGPPPELPAPAAVARETNQLDVFRLAPDNTLRWNNFDGSSWSGWNSLGGMFASGPNAVKLDDGSLWVIALGVDGVPWYLRSAGSGWEIDGSSYHWQRVPLDGMDPDVTPISAPSAVQLTTGEVLVFVRGSDNALWQVTYDDVWGIWSTAGGELASQPVAVNSNAGLDVFALASDRSLQIFHAGDPWAPLAKPWLPACCLGMPIDTGIVARYPTSTNPVDQLNLLDVETGHFLGDGRQQIALSYALSSSIGFKIIDVVDGFRSLKILAYYQKWALYADYYPKLAVGEFDGDAPQEVALAYATRSGGVRVYEHTNMGGIGIAWLKDGTYQIPDYGMNDMISSIIIEPGWTACVYKDTQQGGGKKCFTDSYGYIDSNLHDDAYDTGGSLGDSISSIVVTAPESFLTVDEQLSATDEIYNQRNAYVGIEIFDIDIDTRDTDIDRITYPPVSQVDYYEMVFTDTDDHPAPERTLEIVAGDFDGARNGQLQLNDEIALIWDKVNIGPGDDHYEASFLILNVEADQTGMHISDARDREDIIRDLWDGHEMHYPYSAQIVLTAGDFDGDGRDEIARTWPDRFEESEWPDLWRKLEVLDWDNGWTISTPLELPNYSRYSYQDVVVEGDLDLDLRNEIVFYNSVDDTITPYAYTPDEGISNYGDSESVPIGSNVPVLMTGDFTGDSIRVGPPSYRVQNQMTTPVMFLNLPPMHRDIIFYEGENHLIEVINDAYAQYDTAITNAEVYSTESKKEWDLSTGFEMSVGGGGHSVSASLENTYGENFSNASTQITESVVSDRTTASIYDQIIYNGTDYAVWEYPVFGAEADNPDQAQTISVVWPLTDQTNLPTTRRSTWCDENFYIPGHQLYNVWSYDDISLGQNGFDDLGEKILMKETTGGTTINMRMSENSTATRSSGFHNQISAGLEYSYENELNIPFVGNVFDFSFRAYADGRYAHESLSTFSTEVTDDTGVSVVYPEGSTLPEINAYLYWAKAGYLVADFQTSPDINALPWSRYKKPDPAFILPWYGFPDPEKPELPPCGYDKQLFTHDIELDPAYVQNGDTVTMTATVRNFSNEIPPSPPSDVAVRFYLGDPAGGNNIGLCSIPKSNLYRNLGPQQCQDTWVVSGGSGEEKVYAVIDPSNTFDEMHDEDDVINNNVGYGLLYVANADTFDPGLERKQTYQSILYEDLPGLGFSIHLPTTNITETYRYELIPTDLGEMQIIGDPIQVLAFGGGESEPDVSHTFSPTPAGMMAFYRDADLLPDMDEADLMLFRLGNSGWEEATCPGYDLIRFPQDNRLAVPICQTGTFVLSDQQPDWQMSIYLPMVSR